MTSGGCASSMAVSMSWFAVTQTGQPGPESSVIHSGMTPRRPFLAMATVCVPQTSMILTWRPGSVGVDSLDETPGDLGVAERREVHGRYAPSATRPSSSAKNGKRLEQLERLVGRLLVDDLEGEAGVHEHEVADDGLGNEVERHLAGDAHDVDRGHVVLVDGDDAGGDGETHAR